MTPIVALVSFAAGVAARPVWDWLRLVERWRIWRKRKQPVGPATTTASISEMLRSEMGKRIEEYADQPATDVFARFAVKKDEDK